MVDPKSRHIGFGPFDVDLGTGELRKRGVKIQLQSLPFQVLCVLLEKPGELVTRQELKQRIWGDDTYIDFDQGLNRAVKKIRAALSDSAEQPRYLETLPKRGYRFIGAVEKLVDPKPDFTPHAQPDHMAEVVPAVAAAAKSLASKRASSGFRTFAVLAAAAVSVTALLILASKWDELSLARVMPFSKGHDPVQRTEPYTPRPLTTLAGGEYEPALAPDGNTLAFVWGEGTPYYIYKQAIDASAPVRLTTNSIAEGSPAWSPDGRQVAFITVTEKVQESALFIIPASGGPARKITAIAPRSHIFDGQLDWSPNGNLLAVVDRNSTDEPFAIYTISLDDGVKHRVLTPPSASPGDSGPVFSPDGREIAFHRTQSIGNVDIYIVDCSGGKPRRLTFDQRFTSAHAWSPDGREIFFTSKRSGPISLWRVKASGGSPQPILGIGDGAYNLAVRKDRLLYSRYISDSNVWETILQTGAKRRVLSSTRNERSAQYSPDGTRIAFRSDRTGFDEIWMSDASGQNSVRLTSFNGPLTGTPRWSPDGRFIAFDSRPNGNPDIYVVSAIGGPPRRVTSSGFEDCVPSWSLDGRWLYFASNRSGSWQVWKIASDATAESTAPVQLTHQGGFAAFEAPDGKNVFYAKGRDRPGIWSVTTDGGNERPVTDILRPGYWGNWAVAPTGLFIVCPSPSYGAEVDEYEFKSKRIHRVARLERNPPFSDSGFAVARDGRKLLYTQVDQSSSEIMMVEGFR